MDNFFAFLQFVVYVFAFFGFMGFIRILMRENEIARIDREHEAKRTAEAWANHVAQEDAARKAASEKEAKKNNNG